MNKEKALGLFREILVTGGTLVFGAFDGLTSLVGLLVAVASVLWAIYYHEGLEIVSTSIRKVLSAAPGTLLALGFIAPETAGLLASLIAPLFALVWSFAAKGGNVANVANKAPLVLFALCCATLMSSCAGTTRSPLTGINYTDGKPQIDEQSQATLLWRLSQLFSGVKPKDISKDALPTVNPTK